MDRRQFVETLLVLPFGMFVLRCSSNNGSGGSDAPGAPPTVSAGDAVYTSSDVQAHTHTFGVPLPDFTAPPSSGVSGDTSNNASHTHTVSISASDLMNVEAGSSVMITTSSNSGHTHVFTFVRVS